MWTSGGQTVDGRWTTRCLVDNHDRLVDTLLTGKISARTEPIPLAHGFTRQYKFLCQGTRNSKGEGNFDQSFAPGQGHERTLMAQLPETVRSCGAAVQRDQARPLYLIHGGASTYFWAVRKPDMGCVRRNPDVGVARALERTSGRAPVPTALIAA